MMMMTLTNLQKNGWNSKKKICQKLNNRMKNRSKD